MPLAHTPTPLERMNNLSRKLATPEGEINLWIKRDDCTGLAAGGNKARQLEFYLGEAVAQSADIILTTGAVQSNHVRMTVAAARKLGMDCEVQYEERVANRPSQYYQSGNPFLVKMMGAKIHTYAEGEDEDGADKAMYERANQLSNAGKTPYVIPLAPTHQPIAALGYVLAAEELLKQCKHMHIDTIVLATGSGMTHAGLLTGLRVMGSKTEVIGVCVRREAHLQQPRIAAHCQTLGEMLDQPNIVQKKVICISDATLAPGYGMMNEAVSSAITLLAETEGILLDPTYTGKAMAGMLRLIDTGKFKADQNIAFLHTGGLPGVFGYPELVYSVHWLLESA